MKKTTILLALLLCISVAIFFILFYMVDNAMLLIICTLSALIIVPLQVLLAGSQYRFYEYLNKAPLFQKNPKESLLFVYLYLGCALFFGSLLITEDGRAYIMSFLPLPGMGLALFGCYAYREFERKRFEREVEEEWEEEE